MDGERYQLVQIIGRGGMAEVYEATSHGDDGFQRKVAIKRTLPQSDVSARQMFLNEARIASRLHHGGIVQVYDYGAVDDTEILVMELVDGLDARRASVRGEGMPVFLALHVVSEIAHALAYVHELTDDQGNPLGLIHRDVSPHNVLLSWVGDVKLTDFGISIAADRMDKTAAGIVKGKLHYMAPEQALGETLTGAADIFALGLSLQAMIQVDSAGESRLLAAMSGFVPTLEGFDEDVLELLQGCLAPDPAARPNAAEVARWAGSLAAKHSNGDLRDHWWIGWPPCPRTAASANSISSSI